ncbi:MAG: RdgB/HAM1 family non-canonical purine NTP pyrophosphatase [Thermoflexales bacterium]|nr:RdgB/HAM1 family non-canonical purine NTP pyrophosphatase [Thermoflexales bacterium]MDW8291753.1 RdgB/HAM1 family non-canonical purine NTP pyrophosphatase [Anaerolineae bacterium]
MHPFVLATNNVNKLAEMQQITALLGWEEHLSWHTPQALGIRFEVAETATTYLGNARLKAHALRALLEQGFWVLADDSGLEVDALGGQPGVLSARFHLRSPGGDGCSALLQTLHAFPEKKQRSARFRCVLVVLSPQGEYVFEGVCGGHIASEKRGDRGFGFDPIFIPGGERRTFAEMSPEEKHSMSHRGMALQALIAWLGSSSSRTSC